MYAGRKCPRTWTCKRWLIPTLLLIPLLFTFCQEDPFKPTITGTIQGVVKDAETGDSLPNVTVYTKPATEVVVTGEDGRYRFSGIDTGTYRIIAEKKDYDGKILSIRVKEDKTSNVTILLSQKNGIGSSDIRFTDDFSPGDGAQNQSISPTLSWKATIPNDDSLTYDVFLYPSSAPSKTLVSGNLSVTSVQVDPLAYNTVYRWQVKAMDDNGNAAYSQTLSFQTRSISDNAIFFVRKTGGDYEIMAYDNEREEINQLTFNSHLDWAPRLNARSKRIAFVSDSLVEPFIYTMDKNSSDIRKVTNIPVDGYHNYGNAFDWDEQRGKILFSHYQYLYEIEADGSNMRPIATAPPDRHFREVALSPDGSQILAVTMGEKVYDSEIYLMNRNGSNQQEVVGNMAGIIQSPSWAIDGNSFLFTRDVSGNESIDGRMLNSRIFSYNLANDQTTNLSQNKAQGTNDTHPRYSPTGDQVIFTNAPNNASAPPDIWVMDTDGSNREKLITNGELPFWE